MSWSKRPPQRERTVDEVPKLDAKTELQCRSCGKSGRYAVGRVVIDPLKIPALSAAGPALGDAVGFTGYFHCSHCGAAGPWDLPPLTMIKFMALMSVARDDPARSPIQFGEMRLFDGTVIRTPVEGEAHLKALIASNPEDYYLWNRLGNLYESAERTDLAVPAFTRALELNPQDLESHYSLGYHLKEQRQAKRAQEHFLLALRHCRGAQRCKPQVLRDVVRAALEGWMETQIQLKQPPSLPPFNPAAGGTGEIPITLLQTLNLTTDRGWDALVNIYLTGMLPNTGPSLLGRVFGAAPSSGGTAVRVGRNDPCPCGSRKKFKVCCGKS
jgi:hypothetical protein